MVDRASSGIMMLFVLNIGIDPVHSQCICSDCATLAKSEFALSSMYDCSPTNTDCTCMWRIIDIFWCVVPSYDQQSYSLSINRISDGGSMYTKSCRQCLLETSMLCNLPNIPPSSRPISRSDIGFVFIACVLEIYNFVSGVRNQHKKVKIFQIRCELGVRFLFRVADILCVAIEFLQWLRFSEYVSLRLSNYFKC
jgi:hypothetical protein